jgi:serine/threonine protein phosphatase PrpC
MGDGDSILLASDGLFKTLSNEQILGALNGPPQSWPDALVARTLEREYEFQDNVTVLSVTVQNQPHTLKLPPPAVAVGKPDAPEKAAAPVRSKRSRRLVAAALVIAIAGIAGGGGRWWYKKHHAVHAAEKK